MINSRQSPFTAAPFRSGSTRRVPSRTWGHPFYRRYGANLPSSLSRVISSALGFSPRLPVSDCDTVAAVPLRGFSRRHGFGQLVCPKTHFPTPLGLRGARICLRSSLQASPDTSVRPDGLAFRVTPSVFVAQRRGRNVDLLSIGYAFRPRLRGRLTLGGLALPRKS